MVPTPASARMIRMVISALVAGGLGVGSNILTAMSNGGTVSKEALTVAIITGVMLTLKDVQAYLSQSPSSANA